MNLLSLTFLAPLALLGAAVIAVPLYLHLRHRPRAIPLPFGALQFLLRAQRKRKRKLRAEQWLLMLIRCAFVVVLAALFAQPFREQLIDGTSPSSSLPLLLVLDDSPSMLARQNGELLFERARDLLRSLLNARGEVPTLLLPASKPDAFAGVQEAATLLAGLPALQVQSRSASLDAAYAHAAQIIRTAGWSKARIQVLTDGSFTAWEQTPAAPPEGVELVYSPMLETGSLANAGVCLVQTHEGGAQPELEIRLHNGGPASQAFPLAVGPDEGKQNAHSIQVDGHKSVTHRFALPHPVAPLMRIALPDDDFPLDDVALYQPGTRRNLSVLLVDGDPHPDPEASESFFLQQALALQFGQAVEVITPSGLNGERLAKADVALLLNVDSPPTALLKDFLQRGKGLLIAPGNRFDAELWNAFLAAWEIRYWERVQQTDGLQLRMGPHPLLEGIADAEWEAYLAEVRFASKRLISVGRSRHQVLFTFGDSAPALVCGELERGRMVLLSSALDMDEGNWPVTPGFLPFVRQLVGYLSFAEESVETASLTVDEAFDRGWQDRLLPLHIPAAIARTPLAGLQPGVYRLTGQEPERVVHLFFHSRESDFRSVLDQPESPESRAFQTAGFKTHQRQDLGPSLMWALLWLVVGETLLAAYLSFRWGQR
jgi:hypothetical protein